MEVTRSEETDNEHAFEKGRPDKFFRKDHDGQIQYLNNESSMKIE